MGRRSVRLEDPDRWVFNRLATDYRARPGYPPELLDRLAALAGGAGATAVDLGAGTGLVALPLAERGVRVIAVEPAVAMLRELERSAAPGPVSGVHATAEATRLPDGCADLAVLADAIHWVEPGAAGREVARVLRAGGAVAIVEATPARTAFMDGIAALVEAVNVKARRSTSAAARRDQLLAAAGASPTQVERYAHSEALSPERLDAVLRSLSLVGPALGPTVVEDLLREARRLAENVGGARWSREITLTWGAVSARAR